MKQQFFKYIIVGGGLTGASAIQGIRDIDNNGSIALFGDEKSLPYDRPPLTKKLWFGKMEIEKIFLHDKKYYDDNKVELKLGIKIKTIISGDKTVIDDSGNNYKYEKLLLATGGQPRRLNISGADINDICYYRYLDDYKKIRSRAAEGKSALVIGGGFIGSEIAAALNINKVKVAMIFPEKNICSRVFPEAFSNYMNEFYINKGIEILNEDKPVSFIKKNNLYLTLTEKGKTIESDFVIAGAGIIPEITLAEEDASIKTDNGITVDPNLQTSNPDIYAAGDIAFFPSKALGKRIRIEHWDNALSQGKHAGRNMAGANAPFEYMPYFFSDLFEFGYEAVGEIDSSLKTYSDWQEENNKGVIYYLSGDKVKGIMLCNIWDKVNDARKIIESNGTLTRLNL